MPMNEAIVDFQPVGVVHDRLGEPRMRVVVVAVRREMVERLLGATSEAGLTVEGVDLSAFGMVRALRAAASTPPTSARRSTSTSPASPTSPSPTPPAACSPAPPPVAWTRWSTRSPSAAA